MLSESRSPTSSGSGSGFRELLRRFFPLSGLGRLLVRVGPPRFRPGPAGGVSPVFRTEGISSKLAACSRSAFCQTAYAILKPQLSWLLTD